MAVPARPTSGTPIETAWGQVAHDAVVAQDVQAGAVSVVKPAGVNVPGQVVVTFPRPFASPPIVVANVANASGAGLIVGGASLVTATGFTAWLSRTDGTGSTTTQPVHWIAYGPRA